MPDLANQKYPSILSTPLVPKRKLAFVIGGDETYGVARMTRSLLRALRKRGDAIVVFSLSEGDIVTLLKNEGLEVEIVGDGSPAPNFGSGIIGTARGAYKVTQYFFGTKKLLAASLTRHSVTHAIVRMPNLVFVTAAASNNAGIRSVWIMPNAVSNRYPLNLNKIIYDIFLRITKMKPVANSLYTQTTLLNHFAKSDVMHLGVDTIEFKPCPKDQALLTQLRIPSSAATIGIFSRLIPEKGHTHVIEALADAHLLEEEVALLIFGGPLNTDYHQQLLKIAATLPTNKYVLFMGSNCDIPQGYAICDFTINARVDPEPFGLSVIESMLMEKPILAHASGGPAETVIDGEIGWLFADMRHETLVHALRRALSNRSLWKMMGERARAHACMHYSSEAMANRLGSIINEIRT